MSPRDALEKQLVESWQRRARASNVGIHDNFFDIGGYSLLATRLFAIIEAATGRRIPLSALFEAPTIAELADGDPRRRRVRRGFARSSRSSRSDPSCRSSTSRRT